MNNKLKGCFLHRSDDWSTPKEIYDYFISLGFLDPCPLYSDKDCLVVDYYDSCLFVNPPYSKLNDFSKWIYKQVLHNCSVVLLVPARTDTRWFHYLLDLKPSIVFIKGRLKFGNSKFGAPFPSILMVFNYELSKSVFENKDWCSEMAFGR